MTLEWNGSIGAKLAEGLVTAQAEAASVYKGRQSGGDGGGPRYKYASTEDVVVVAKDALKAGKLAVVQLAATRTGTEKISTTYRTGTFPGDELRVDYLLVHESGESVKITTHTPVIPGPGRPWDKAVAAAETYSMGYALRGILLLVRTDEKEEVDARDDSDVGVAVHRRPDNRKPNNKPTASTGGVSLLSPPADAPSRAASSGPSNGGAPLPTPTAEVKAAIEAAFPGAEVGEPRYADDFLKAEFKRFAADFGREWCQGFGTTKGLDAEGRAKLYERMKAEAQRLDTLSVDEWKLYAVELDKVKVGLAEEVWSSVMPEKVASIEEAHVVQIDRLYKAADKALGDVPL